MRKSIIMLTAFCLIFVFLCCHTPSNIPKDVQTSINKAGVNKSELVSVIEHYNKKPADSLKLKAAYFLITNMDDRYYYEGDLLNNYLTYFKLINRDVNHGEYYIESFKELYGDFSLNKLNIRFDIEEVKSDQLIGNIDMAFKVWKEQPWGKNISFEQFCEYVLPFRIEDEKPEYDREEIYTKYNKRLDFVIKAKGDAVAACKALNDEFINQKWLFTHRIDFLPHFSTSKLLEYRVGSCRDMADFATFTMRATGIPVGNDFVINWPWRRTGHNWNVVLNNQNKIIAFLGAEDSPGTPHMPNRKKGKVYRRTYAKNPQTLAMIRSKNEIIPPFFLNSRIKDVTDEYVKCFNIDVPLAKSSYPNKYAYISVYNNKSWVPVDWGRLNNNTVIFHKMEGDIIYMAGYYEDMFIKPANYPFLLQKDGSLKYLKADSSNLNNTFSVSRIFPVTSDFFVVDKMIGGVFQGANRIDFKDAVTLDSVSIKPYPFWNEKTISNKTKFRYVRYLSPFGRQCNIGEAEFYNKKIKLKGKIIGKNDHVINDSTRTFEKAMDGDITTLFEAQALTAGWVGIDLKVPSNIDAIRFSPAMKEPRGATKQPKGLVIDGHKYTLFYWDKTSQWVSLGSELAKKSQAVFKHVPTNGLYQLKDETESVDARIFTYENGKQVWW